MTNCQTYLQDLATSNGVQVFEGIDEALTATAEWLRHRSGSSNSSTSSANSNNLTKRLSSVTSSSVLQRSTSLNSSATIMQSQQLQPNQSMQQVTFTNNSKRIDHGITNCGDELLRMNSNECRLRNIKNRGRRPLFLVTSSKRSLVEMILVSITSHWHLIHLSLT